MEAISHPKRLAHLGVTAVSFSSRSARRRASRLAVTQPANTSSNSAKPTATRPTVMPSIALPRLGCAEQQTKNNTPARPTTGGRIPPCNHCLAHPQDLCDVRFLNGTGGPTPSSFSSTCPLSVVAILFHLLRCVRRLRWRLWSSPPRARASVLPHRRPALPMKLSGLCVRCLQPQPFSLPFFRITRFFNYR